MTEHRSKVLAAPRVDGRGLHDRALGRDQPMKSLARGQLADGAGRRAAGANQRNGSQGAAHGLKIHAAVERQQGRLVEVDGSLEYPLDIAGENDSRIDELASL